ncbi:RNA polymerase sigma factor [Pedobacter cryoconitis]|uniref:RNA polymerase sigma-70 factor (ECF subfamily) n=1 Tax=Pedobacter cryoconitis TaxID=188932 RepID=A0A7X0MHF3_9SPHI|nr:sigma-70 family RNA polymerase sigma factor [Pedobacter cryoconitis]MBB6499307.1 RNA polymerase sigma-70 factor (ECF subfamily) [Pedobacter cryoconitis]
MDTLQQGEHFLAVIEQNKGIIYKIANSFNKDEDDKKDLVQEITLQLWRAFPGYDQRSKISTWMYRVALNVAITFYRKEKRKNELMTPISENVIAFTAEDASGDNNSNLQFLQQFINELKELDRALMLLYLEEKSQKEMAEILGLSETNIGTKISRIKEKLKQRFSKINN